MRLIKISLMQALRNDPDITVNTELADEYDRRCAAEPVDNGFWGALADVL